MTQFKIIVPTKNRPDTVVHAITTIRRQTYEKWKLVVFDSSTDGRTSDLLQGETDSRIQYVRNRDSSYMAKNWQKSLEFIEPNEYVHVMGDDNGLVSDALSWIDSICTRSNPTAISCGPPIHYDWPFDDGYVTVIYPPGQARFSVFSCRRYLKNVVNFRVGFDKGPNINSGFISSNLLNEIIDSGTLFFDGTAPDVYSALVTALHSEEYIYSWYPIFINGGSRHSNGKSADAPELQSTSDEYSIGKYEPSQKYFKSNSYYLTVAEAMAKAIENVGSDELSVSPKQVLNFLVRQEIEARNRFWLLEDARLFARKHGIALPVPRAQSRTSRPGALISAGAGQSSYGAYQYFGNGMGLRTVAEMAEWIDQYKDQLPAPDNIAALKNAARTVALCMLLGASVVGAIPTKFKLDPP